MTESVKTAESFNPLPQNSKTVICSGNAALSSSDIIRLVSNSPINNTTGIKDKVIAVYADSPIGFVIAVISVWNAGGIILPLDPNLTESEKSLLLNIAAPDFIFKASDFYNFEDIKSDKTECNFEINIDFTSDKSALLLFTSGSSGNPKCVSHTLRTIRASIANTAALINNTGRNKSVRAKWLLSLPPFHIGGFQIITRTLLFDHILTIPEFANTDGFEKAILKHKPGFISLVPSMILKFCQEALNNLREASIIFIGGGKLTKKVSDTIYLNNLPVINVYGSTETCSMSAYASSNRFPNDYALTTEEEFYDLISAFTPLQKTNIKIADNSGNVLNTGCEGEVIIKTDSLFTGYHPASSSFDNIFISGNYRTGDVGFLGDDGKLRLIMRRTDLIISGGKNINPFEIENELTKIQYINDAAVTGISDEFWGEITAALVCSGNPEIITPEFLKSILKQKLSGYKIPKLFLITEKMPLFESGKVNYPQVKSILQDAYLKKL